MNDDNRDDECLQCWEKLSICTCGYTQGYSDQAIYCPYCGFPNDPSKSDGLAYDENTKEYDCDKCGETFLLEVYMSPKWSKKNEQAMIRILPLKTSNGMQYHDVMRGDKKIGIVFSCREGYKATISPYNATSISSATIRIEVDGFGSDPEAAVTNAIVRGYYAGSAMEEKFNELTSEEIAKNS